MSHEKKESSDSPEKPSPPPQTKVVKKDFLGRHVKAVLGAFGPETDAIWRACHIALERRFPGLPDHDIVKRTGKILAGILDDSADVVGGPLGVLMDILSDGLEIVFSIKDPDNKSETQEVKRHWLDGFAKSANDRIEKAAQAGASPQELQDLTDKLEHELQIRRNFFDHIAEQRREMEAKEHKPAPPPVPEKRFGEFLQSATAKLEQLPGGMRFRKDR